MHKLRHAPARKSGRFAVLAFALLIAGCATTPPSPAEQGDLCAVFEDRRDWFRAAARSEERWGVPVALQMAIISHESGFNDEARPPRGERRFLGLLPGKRPSTAFGYAQALDATWEDFRRETGREGADRDDFYDAVDFIGWYGDRSSRLAGIRKTDAVAQYLAYHEGPAGYSRGSWRNNSALIATAQRVGETAWRYDEQLQSCRKGLEGGWLPFF
jgi:hypothetical protein